MADTPGENDMNRPTPRAGQGRDGDPALDDWR